MEIHIFYKSLKKYGGQEKVIYNLIDYLSKKGHKIFIYSYKLKDKIARENVIVKKVTVPLYPLWLKTLYFSIYTYLKAKNIKRVNEQACIFGFGKTFYQDVYRSGGGVHKFYFKRATLKHRNKLLRALYIIRKILSPGHWVNIFIEYLTYNSKTLRVIIVPSLFVKNQIQQCFKIKSIPIEIIRNSLSRDKFYPDTDKKVNFRKKHSIKDDEIILSFVSTNHKLKGLDYLLDAVKLLKDKGEKFKLLVAGSGSETYFKKRIKQLDLSSNVIMFGKLKDVREIYQASDIFVYPTLFDTFGYVVLEAMYCGCVPVVSKFCGASEIIESIDRDLIIEDPIDYSEIYLKIYNHFNAIKREKIKEKVEKIIPTLSREDINERIENILIKYCINRQISP